MFSINIQRLRTLTSNTANKELQENIENLLNSAGIYCRVFSRIKSAESIEKKLSEKEKKYISEDRKMQDLIGIRIVLYFSDDVAICKKLVEKKYEIDDKNSEIDCVSRDKFEAVRYNLICRLPERISSYFEKELWDNYLIDKTFEVQIRTIFSEGWHEVEHDIRYKHKDEWIGSQYEEYARFLNSIFATLEMCDTSIINLMDKMAYNAYVNSKIEEMLRYKFRIRFSEEALDDSVKYILLNNRTLLKKIFRADRLEILQTISSPGFEAIPNTMNNIVFICNAIDVKDEELLQITPLLIMDRMSSLEGK